MSKPAETLTTFKRFQTVKEFCVTSGLSCKMIREGCRSGRIPHLRIGEGQNARFMINAALALEQLNEESIKTQEGVERYVE